LQLVSFPKVLLSLTLIAALAACGGGKSQSNSSADSGNGAGTTGTAAPANNQATPDEGASAGNGGSMAGATGSTMSTTAAAPVPANLNCGTATPVWANQRTHVYHTSSDPLYGRTKHGAYMCPDAAKSAGYRVAAGRGKGGRDERRRCFAGCRIDVGNSPLFFCAFA
jgi:hypothetical protein